MERYIKPLLLSLMSAVLIGCGPSVDLPEQTEDTASWMTEGFAITGKQEEGQALWAGQYLPWEHNKSQTLEIKQGELSRLDCGVCEELFWYLGKGEGKEYVLETYDTFLEKSMAKAISLEELGLEEGLAFLCDLDMWDGEHYVFRWVGYRQDENGLYYQTADGMVYTDLATVTQSVDFRDIYLEKGFYQEEEPALQPILQSLDWRCDGKGNICVTVPRENKGFGFFLFNQNGEMILEYESTAEQSMPGVLRTSEGELILPIYDNGKKCYEYFWVDTAKRELRSLARMDAASPDIRQIYGMLENDLYYRSQEGAADVIVRWNVRNGNRTQIFDLRAAGIDSRYQTLLALRKGQTPVLCLMKSKEEETKEWLTVLTEQKPENNGAVRVADLVANGETKEQVAACTVLASMETPDLRYEYEEASAQENRDRILAELSQGKGPELLFVQLEDMALLEEKGLLLDIGELLSEDMQEELLPGALKIGTVGGKLVGVPVAVRAETLAVATDTWTGNTWKLEDVIDLMEKGKLTGAIRSCPPYRMGKYMEPSLTVLSLINPSLKDSFLIDWEMRKCHFDDERFIRLLELTYTDLSGTPSDAEVWLNGGKDILQGYFTHNTDFLDFFAHMEAEDGNIVGYPTEGVCGSYLVAEGGVLVVNANIEQKEVAVCFLETLLGEELQARATTLCMSVRKLVPEDYIMEDDTGRHLYMGNDKREIAVFGDSDTALHRAAAFLETCEASPYGYSQIRKIIVEELSAMYLGGKSPETVAGNINNRVQLYLDEGN